MEYVRLGSTGVMNKKRKEWIRAHCEEKYASAVMRGESTKPRQWKK